MWQNRLRHILVGGWLKWQPTGAADPVTGNFQPQRRLHSKHISSQDSVLETNLRHIYPFLDMKVQLCGRWNIDEKS